MLPVDEDGRAPLWRVAGVRAIHSNQSVIAQALLLFTLLLFDTVVAAVVSEQQHSGGEEIVTLQFCSVKT